MVVLLMQHGADPAIQDGEGCSTIHLAAQFGHTSIVAYLIAKGQDVDLQDRNGMTPLMWASHRVFGSVSQLHNSYSKDFASLQIDNISVQIR